MGFELQISGDTNSIHEKCVCPGLRHFHRSPVIGEWPLLAKLTRAPQPQGESISLP
jgi:hypothetical protein